MIIDALGQFVEYEHNEDNKTAKKQHKVTE
jgi:hypothetical protein